MTNTHVSTQDDIQQRVRQNLIRSLCTEFSDLTLHDLHELIQSHPATKRALVGITVGDLMNFHHEEEAVPANGRATNGDRSSSKNQADAEVLARLADLPRPSMELGWEEFDPEVLRFIAAAGVISQALLTHALHDPKGKSKKRRTYIRVQRATKRLADRGQIESFKQGTMVYHRIPK